MNNNQTTIRVDKWILDELRNIGIGMVGDKRGQSITVGSIITRLIIERVGTKYIDEDKENGCDESASHINTSNGFAQIGDTLVAINGQTGKYVVSGIGNRGQLGFTSMTLEPLDKYTSDGVLSRSAFYDYAILKEKRTLKMKNKVIFIGEQYYVNPTTIKFSSMANSNKIQEESEYIGTKESILKTGQIKPIYINSSTGLCDDGRLRCRICTELGIDVKCVKINGSLDSLTSFLVCNENTTSGRGYSTAQRAIEALRRSKEYNIPFVQASKMMIVNPREVSYAATLSGFGYDSSLDEIMNTGSSKIDGMDRPTKSLETLCRYAKKLGEKT